MPITKIPKQIKAKIMNILSWGVETWRAIFEFVSIGAGLLAVMGAGLTLSALIGIAMADRSIKRREAAENEQKALRLLNLEKANIEAQRALERERKTRLELEESIAPRILPVILNARGESNIDPLRLFAGVNVQLETLPDAEPRRIAGNIVAVLERAGWSVSYKSNPNLADPMNDGIRIETDPPWDLKTAGPLWKTEKALGYKAGEALKTFMTLNGVHARTRERIESSDPNLLKIFISLKPELYFDEKFHRGWSLQHWSEETVRKHDEMSERMKRDEKKEAEDLWKALGDEWRAKKTTAPQTPKSNTP